MMEYYEHKLDPVGTRPEWLDDDDWMWPRNTFGEYITNNFGDANKNWSWDYITAIRIPQNHWAVPALKAGKVPVRKPVLTEEMVRGCFWSADERAPGIDGVVSLLREHGVLPESTDPIKAALQDKWPMLDTDALRETLAKNNLKIVEA